MSEDLFTRLARRAVALRAPTATAPGGTVGGIEWVDEPTAPLLPPELTESRTEPSDSAPAVSRTPPEGPRELQSFRPAPASPARASTPAPAVRGEDSPGSAHELLPPPAPVPPPPAGRPTTEEVTPRRLPPPRTAREPLAPPAPVGLLRAAPVPVPAAPSGSDDRGQAAPVVPPVEVTIDRVEIRLSPARTPLPAVRRDRPASPPTAVPLAEYLRRREAR